MEYYLVTSNLILLSLFFVFGGGILISAEIKDHQEKRSVCILQGQNKDKCIMK